MLLYRDIWLLGWPLFLGMAWSVALLARLREQWRDAAMREPAIVSRALLYFAEGDVLRALVLLEGEAHPLCRLLSGFWKQIPTPRQWEGTALIAEYQRRVPLMFGPLRRAVAGFGQVSGATILIELAWLALHDPAVLQPPFSLRTLAVPGGGVLCVLLVFGVWSFLRSREFQQRLRILAVQANQAVYQSIEALDHGRQGAGSWTPSVITPRAAPPPVAGTSPPNYVSRAYKP